MTVGPGCAGGMLGGMEGVDGICVDGGNVGWMAGVESLEESRRVNSSCWPACCEFHVVRIVGIKPCKGTVPETPFRPLKNTKHRFATPHPVFICLGCKVV